MIFFFPEAEDAEAFAALGCVHGLWLYGVLVGFWPVSIPRWTSRLLQTATKPGRWVSAGPRRNSLQELGAATRRRRRSLWEGKGEDLPGIWGTKSASAHSYEK